MLVIIEKLMIIYYRIIILYVIVYHKAPDVYLHINHHVPLFVMLVIIFDSGMNFRFFTKVFIVICTEYEK